MKKFSIVFKSGLTLNVVAASCITAIKETLKDHSNLTLKDILRVSENKFCRIVEDGLIEGETLN